MKNILIGLVLLFSASAFAGKFTTFDSAGERVTKKVDSVSINHYTLGISPNKGTVCNISTAALKDAGIDPVSLGQALKNGKAYIQCGKDNKIETKEELSIYF